MKPIIIATDYSVIARNAADYAAQLAKAAVRPLIVFHAWTPPAPMGANSIPVVAPVDELESVQLSAVQAEADRIAKTWGIPVQAMSRLGFAAEEVQEYAAECDAALIVMGMRHTGPIGRFFGSVATATLRQLKVPVLIVPEEVKYTQPDTILLATDLSTDRDWSELEELKNIAGIFHSDIHVINVVKEEQVLTATEGRSGLRLENRMKDYPHTWHFPVDDDVSAAISATADKIEAGWIAVVPHHLPWYKEVFHSSVSKKVAFTTHRPLLALTGGAISK